MTRDLKVQLGAGAVLLAALAGSAALSLQMTSIAGRERLTYTDRAEDGDRWEVSLGIAMGAFRGIFVNALWMRANEMKEEGKFYEAVELARAITRLQPRFPRVWIFHAWNLAYNISVMTQTREERWNWVNQGIGLLRDEGIPANPNDLLIHKELAWIFLHKIQGVTDDANQYYKRRVAQEWTVVLGPPPPRDAKDRSREHAIEKYATWLEGFMTAALSVDELVQRQPLAATLIEHLRTSDAGLAFDTPDQRRELLERVELSRAFIDSNRRFLMDRMAGPRTTALNALLEDPAFAPAWDELLRHVRRRVLVEDYRMEPERMVRYTRKYGPLDWRHPAAHSLYWSARGVEEALSMVNVEAARETQRLRALADDGRISEAEQAAIDAMDNARAALRTKDATDRLEAAGDNRRDFDFLNTDRIVVQSVQELFRYGELYFDFKASVLGEYAVYVSVPNPHFAQTYGDILDEIRTRAGIVDAQTRERAFSPLSAGYENFLIDVTLFFYQRGDRQEAERWLERLRTMPDMNLVDRHRQERFAVLEEFVPAELADRFTTPNVAVLQVGGALMNAYASGLLAQDPDLFRNQFNYAVAAHRYFFEQQARRSAVNPEAFRMAVMDPDFRLVAGPLFAQFIASLGPEDAETVYAGAPDDLRLWAYDVLEQTVKPQVDAEVQIGGRAFAQMFPAPSGLQEHRAMLERLRRERAASPVQMERQ